MDDLEKLEKATDILVRALDNISQSMNDDYIQANAKFRTEAGMTAKIIRKLNGETCDWCRALAGQYTYGEEPREVYQRHDNCDCTVEYVAGKTRQDVWTKRKIVRMDEVEPEYGSPIEKWNKKEFESPEELIKSALEGANPNYDINDPRYATNCHNCVCAFEMRMRGYDVEAMPFNLYNSKHPELMWKKCKVIATSGTGKEDIIEELQRKGDGARYAVSVLYSDVSGHIFIAMNINNDILFLDPQIGAILSDDYWNLVMENRTRMWRIDDLELSIYGMLSCDERR